MVNMISKVSNKHAVDDVTTYLKPFLDYNTSLKPYSESLNKMEKKKTKNSAPLYSVIKNDK